jgi:hypothetical protein
VVVITTTKISFPDRLQSAKSAQNGKNSNSPADAAASPARSFAELVAQISTPKEKATVGTGALTSDPKIDVCKSILDVLQQVLVLLLNANTGCKCQMLAAGDSGKASAASLPAVSSAIKERFNWSAVHSVVNGLAAPDLQAAAGTKEKTVAASAVTDAKAKDAKMLPKIAQGSPSFNNGAPVSVSAAAAAPPKSSAPAAALPQASVPANIAKIAKETKAAAPIVGPDRVLLKMVLLLLSALRLPPQKPAIQRLSRFCFDEAVQSRLPLSGDHSVTLAAAASSSTKGAITPSEHKEAEQSWSATPT